MSEDSAIIRTGRNFVIITFLLILIFLFCFYITGTLVLISISGKWSRIESVYSLPIASQFLYFIKAISFYWAYYIKNFSKLGLTDNSFFALKLWISTFLPYSLLFSFGWVFRAPLIDWRPFKKPESIHGDAKWATPKQIKKMGLRSKSGVLLGKYKKEYLIADGYQHVLLFAPTGSGKGVGFVIPNLLF